MSKIAVGSPAAAGWSASSSSSSSREEISWEIAEMLDIFFPGDESVTDSSLFPDSGDDDELGGGNSSHVQEKMDEGIEEENNNKKKMNPQQPKMKKPRFLWTPDMHHKFLAAIEAIGPERAVPAKIMQLMGVEGLTRHIVSSHLQKYRSSLKKENEQVRVVVADDDVSLMSCFGVPGVVVQETLSSPCCPLAAVSSSHSCTSSTPPTPFQVPLPLSQVVGSFPEIPPFLDDPCCIDPEMNLLNFDETSMADPYYIDPELSNLLNFDETSMAADFSNNPYPSGHYNNVETTDVLVESMPLMMHSNLNFTEIWDCPNGKNRRKQKKHPVARSTAAQGKTKKDRFLWTEDMNRKFVTAIESLGNERAVPTKLIEVMGVPGLTRHIVASHLQKYRLKTKAAKDAEQVSSKTLPIISWM